MLAVFGDVRPDRGDLDDLVAKRLGVTAGQRCVAMPADVGSEFNDVIGRELWS